MPTFPAPLGLLPFLEGDALTVAADSMETDWLLHGEASLPVSPAQSHCAGLSGGGRHGALEEPLLPSRQRLWH